MEQYVANGFRVIRTDLWRLTANPTSRKPTMTCEQVARSMTTDAPDRFSHGTEFRVMVHKEYAVVDEGYRILIQRPIPREEQGEFFDPGKFSIVGSVSFANHDRPQNLGGALGWVLKVLEVGGHITHDGGSHCRKGHIAWHEDVRYVMVKEGAADEGRYEDQPLLAADGDEAKSIILDQAFDPQVVNHGSWYLWRVDYGVPPKGDLVPSRVADWVLVHTSSDRDRNSFSIEWVSTERDTPHTRRARATHARR